MITDEAGSAAPIASDKPGVGAYMQYLDKEMTIMAALSAFAIASVALVMNAFAGESKESSVAQAVWAHAPELVVAGSAAQLLAGLYFYLQRSNLAWMYGQICLTLVPGGHPDRISTRAAVENADSWSTWVSYRIAFTWLCLGYIFYGLAIADQIPHSFSVAWHRWRIWAVGLPFPLIAIWSLIEWRVLNVFAFANHPWRQARAHRKRLLPRRWNRKANPAARARLKNRKDKKRAKRR